MLPCPICLKAAAPRSENKAAPFCSPRCKLVDLGKWLNEKYAVPTSETPDADDRLASPGEDA
jgi:endogenous inhibitor of DNA gyrase (YacG/DUF329 family)